LVPRVQSDPLLRVLASVAHVMVAIIGLVMTLAPFAVFALIFGVTARFGFDLLGSLLAYVVTVVGSLAVFAVAGYATVLRLVARRSPKEFFRKGRVVAITAFSTSSSNATLPTTMRVVKRRTDVFNERPNNLPSPEIPPVSFLNLIEDRIVVRLHLLRQAGVKAVTHHIRV
jgi:DAACS family dicarboxylate/amino acid:cation (Na+ or H+) symporter